jgi:hypothetical protein
MAAMSDAGRAARRVDTGGEVTGGAVSGLTGATPPGRVVAGGGGDDAGRLPGEGVVLDDGGPVVVVAPPRAAFLEAGAEPITAAPTLAVRRRAAMIAPRAMMSAPGPGGRGGGGVGRHGSQLGAGVCHWPALWGRKGSDMASGARSAIGQIGLLSEAGSVH